MKYCSPALPILIFSTELLHPKRTGDSYKFLPLLYCFLESVLKVHQQLVCDEVVQEHKLLENHSLRTIYHYEMFHIIPNGTTPVFCNIDLCAFSVEVVQKYPYD